MNSGSSPCAPRYFEVTTSAAPWPSCAWLPLDSASLPPPPMRWTMEESRPVSCAMMRSTGPPGANWMMTKLISMMPNSVGMIEQEALEEIGGHRAGLSSFSASQLYRRRTTTSRSRPRRTSASRPDARIRPRRRRCARPYTTAAPNSVRRAARGRVRARPSPTRARDLASTILSMRASTTGSLMPARLKLPSMAAASDPQ